MIMDLKWFLKTASKIWKQKYLYYYDHSTCSTLFSLSANSANTVGEHMKQAKILPECVVKFLIRCEEAYKCLAQQLSKKKYSSWLPMLREVWNVHCPLWMLLLPWLMALFNVAWYLSAVGKQFILTKVLEVFDRWWWSRVLIYLEPSGECSLYHFRPLKTQVLVILPLTYQTLFKQFLVTIYYSKWSSNTYITWYIINTYISFVLGV